MVRNGRAERTVSEPSLRRRLGDTAELPPVMVMVELVLDVIFFFVVVFVPPSAFLRQTLPSSQLIRVVRRIVRLSPCVPDGLRFAREPHNCLLPRSVFGGLAGSTMPSAHAHLYDSMCENVYLETPASELERPRSRTNA